MVGDEGAGEGAAVERLQDRRLGLDEAVLVEPVTDLGDRLRPLGEDPAAVLVGEEVELAPAVAGLDVLEAVELVGRRSQALGQQPPVVDRQRQLAAAAGRDRRPLDPDQVAEVEVDQEPERLLAEHVLAGVELDLAAAVAEVEEAGLAVAAAGDDAPGDPVAGLGLEPRRQPLVGGPHLGDLLALGEAVREGVDAGIAQRSSFSPVASTLVHPPPRLPLPRESQIATLGRSRGRRWAGGLCPAQARSSRREPTRR